MQKRQIESENLKNAKIRKDKVFITNYVIKKAKLLQRNGFSYNEIVDIICRNLTRDGITAKDL